MTDDFRLFVAAVEPELTPYQKMRRSAIASAWNSVVNFLRATGPVPVSTKHKFTPAETKRYRMRRFALLSRRINRSKP